MLVESHGLILACRSWFGAQGDVESLASRKSDELLSFFESVSGSDKYMYALNVVFVHVL